MGKDQKDTPIRIQKSNLNNEIFCNIFSIYKNTMRIYSKNTYLFTLLEAPKI